MDTRFRNNLIWLLVFIALDVYNFTIGGGPSLLTWIGLGVTVIYAVMIFVEHSKTK